MLALPLRGSTPELYHGKYVAGMFGAGEQGVWYDPSDMSTMFQDAAGTTPVTAVGQPVGLILDKSKGAVLSNGAAAYNFLFYTEEITNAYWAPTQVSKSATTAPDGTNTACKVVATAINAQHHVLPTPEPRIPAGGPVLKYSFFAKSEGYRYLGIWGLNALSYFDLVDGVVVSKSVNHISATITKLSGGWNYIDIRFVRYNPNSYRIYTIETPGVHAFLGDGVSGCSIWHPDLRLESNANAQPVYQPIGSDTWLSQIPGNHATQATTASRPTLSARVNLLTKTEQFNDAAWVAARATITANNTTAPNGTLTADRITETTDSGTHRVFHPVSFQPNTTYTASVCFKKGTRRWGWVTLQTDSTPATQIAQFFDLDTGLLGSNNTGAGGTQASRVSAAMTSLDNGWYRCSLTVAFGANISSNGFAGIYIGLSNADNVNSYNGSTSDYNWIWGTDLRAANDALNQPAYQRVNTATDYDTAGFPYCLLFDGVDDYLSTGSIDFSSTDKMTVFAGVRKLSDAAGFLAELSAERAVNNGAWSLIAPGGLGVRQGYYFSSKGTLDSSNGVDSGYASPITNILTGLGDISGDLATLRVNGTQAASRTADQGTGNYGNYPLYIGRRGGTSLPFNGRLYGLIVRGAATDDAHLTHAEKFLAYKSGVTL